MPLTLNELAARIASSPEREDLMRMRVQGWTTKWLLRGSAPGRGGVRKWHHRMILDAALLSVLTDSGLQPAAWDLRLAFYHLRDAAAAWAGGDTQVRWLQLRFFPPRSESPPPDMPRGVCEAHHLLPAPGQERPELVLSSRDEAVTVVDLTAILRRLKWGPEDQEAVEADSSRRIIP